MALHMPENPGNVRTLVTRCVHVDDNLPFRNLGLLDDVGDIVTDGLGEAGRVDRDDLRVVNFEESL